MFAVRPGRAGFDLANAEVTKDSKRRIFATVLPVSLWAIAISKTPTLSHTPTVLSRMCSRDQALVRELLTHSFSLSRAVMALLLLVACGGHSAALTGNLGTPKGAFPVAVKGTSGAVGRSTTLSLVVQ